MKILAALLVLCVAPSSAFVVNALSAPAVRRNAVSSAVEYFQKLHVTMVHTHTEMPDVISPAGASMLSHTSDDLEAVVNSLGELRTSARAVLSSAAWPSRSYAIWHFV